MSVLNSEIMNPDAVKMGKVVGVDAQAQTQKRPRSQQRRKTTGLVCAPMASSAASTRELLTTPYVKTRMGGFSLSSPPMPLCYPSSLAARCPMGILHFPLPPRPPCPGHLAHLSCVLLCECLAGRRGSSSDG